VAIQSIQERTAVTDTRNLGLVSGVKKGAERHRQYRETYERWLADRGAI
jgi:hypothetical protein